MGDASGASRKPYRWLKPVTAVLGLVPLAVIGARFFLGALGANPIATGLNQVGLWTLILLLASLACSPIKTVLGWTWQMRIRRMLGLLTFFYALVHFLVYIGADQYFDWDEIWKDIVKRKFMTVGFFALMILLPLAVTSTNKMVKRLGFVRWKRLHRLVYVAAVAAIVHFIWRVKADLLDPLIYAGVLAVLMGIRVVQALRKPAP